MYYIYNINVLMLQYPITIPNIKFFELFYIINNFFLFNLFGCVDGRCLYDLGFMRYNIDIMASLSVSFRNSGSNGRSGAYLAYDNSMYKFTLMQRATVRILESKNNSNMLYFCCTIRIDYIYIYIYIFVINMLILKIIVIFL